MIAGPYFRSAVWGLACAAIALLLLGLGAGISRAELRFSSSSVNIGEARTGAPASHRFAFVNQGPDPVEITETRAGCGCLTPHLEQRVYQPGEAGSLLLEVHTLGQPAGPHTWTVQVQYRSGGVLREVPLQLKALLVSEITVQPAALTVFADRAVAHEILFTDLRAKPLQITRIHSSSAALTARLGEPTRDAAGHWLRRIPIEVAEDFPEGRHEEVIDIYTADPAYPDLKVRVTVIKHLRQRLAAFPARVVLTATSGAALPSQLVRVRDSAGQVVAIENVTADDPAISCRWAEGPGGMATVKISVDQQQLHADRLESAVHVQVRAPVRETLTIPVCVGRP
jgi:hypothetical protein